jgi:hypothetical protein
LERDLSHRRPRAALLVSVSSRLAASEGARRLRPPSLSTRAAVNDAQVVARWSWRDDGHRRGAAVFRPQIRRLPFPGQRQAGFNLGGRGAVRPAWRLLGLPAELNLWTRCRQSRFRTGRRGIRTTHGMGSSNCLRPARPRDALHRPVARCRVFRACRRRGHGGRGCVVEGRESGVAR